MRAIRRCPATDNEQGPATDVCVARTPLDLPGYTYTWGVKGPIGLYDRLPSHLQVRPRRTDGDAGRSLNVGGGWAPSALRETGRNARLMRAVTPR